jgi:two-component system sensor histidine kinase MprB
MVSLGAVHSQLLHQVDDSLLVQPLAPLPVEVLCQPLPEVFAVTSRLQIRLQRVSADGSACGPDSATSIPVSAQDIAVARTGTGGGLRDAYSGKIHLRVRVLPARTKGYAVQVARPLTETDDTLARLATFLISGTLLTLLTVTGLAVLLARRLLGPVGALTWAAEHITRTDDLNVPIEVTGHDEVARLATAFNQMTVRLAHSRQRQQQLVVDASHELRTPLTSLRTNIELLARSQKTGRPLAPEVSSRLYTNITAQTIELTGLIEELMELARDQLADVGIEPVPLDDVITRAVERVRLRAARNPVAIAELQPCDVRGDPQSLERAVVNLLDNAVKFSPDDAPVTVSLRVRGRTAVVEIRDHGRGISQEDLPWVFDRFWRAADSRDLPGSGLGLAIVRQTAQAHGGTVDLAPADGGGTLAHLHLPLSDER